MTVSELSSQLKEGRERTGLQPILFIDYLQIMDVADTSASNDERIIVKEVLKRLRTIALKYNFPIFAVSTISRSFYNRSADLTALGSSAFIEYNADTVLHMCREKSDSEEDDGKRTILLSNIKNRYGDSERTTKLSYDARRATFTEVF